MATLFGRASIPDGRAVYVIDKGMQDDSVNVFESDEDYPKFCWDESNIELSPEECEQEIAGTSLHDYVIEHIHNWEHMGDEDDEESIAC